MRLIWSLFLAGISLSLAGCAGYKLGPTAGFAAGSRSIQINLFENQTWEPRLSDAVGSSLRKLIQQDGTYRLATHGEGDVIVSGNLTEYRRSVLSNQPRDVRTPRDFSISLTARVIATERSTGKILMDREVSGRTTVRSGPDFTSIQRQQLPLIAEDLARNITQLLVDGEW